MTANVKIQLGATANFKGAQAQIRALATEVEAMDKRVQKSLLGGGSNLAGLADAKNLTNTMRKTFSAAAQVGAGYTETTFKMASATEQFTKRLIDNKASMAEIIGNRARMRQVFEEQIALRRGLATSWGRTSDGRLKVDQFVNPNAAGQIARLSEKVGFLGEQLYHGSKQLVNWGKNMQWAGRQLMVGLSLPLTLLAGVMGKFAFDLEKSLTRIVKVYGDAGSQWSQTTESINQMAKDTLAVSISAFGAKADDTLNIMAELAAAGRTGSELQQQTLATQRAAVIGELNWQDAVKATISLQSVYHHNAAQIGDDFNYINAMENETVLTAQDFVEAIPRVSGVMQTLGADLKQTGALMTAFKAAGIDAAEGANALKSINFRLVATYGKGLKTFQEKTGQNLKAIIDETKGQTIPTLLKFGEAISGLKATDKVAVTRDVFGIYQGSKALMLIDQIMQKTEQWQRAMDVGNNSNMENAAIAQREIDRVNATDYKKIEKALEQIKLSLAGIGAAFLPVASGVLNFVKGFVDTFSKLPDGVKSFALIFAGIAALTGPLVMISGLFANLIGQFGVAGGAMIRFLTKFKLLTPETAAQMKMQELATAARQKGISQEMKALDLLIIEMQKYNAEIARTKALSATGAGVASRPAYTQGMLPLGPSVPAPTPFPRWSGLVNSPTMTQVPPMATIAAQTSLAQAEKATAIASKASTTLFGISTLGMLASNSMNPVLQKLTAVAFGLSTIAMLAPKAFGSIGLAAVNAGKRLAGAAGISGIMSKMTGILGGLGPYGKAAAAALAVVGLAWFKIKGSTDEAAKSMNDYNNTAKSMSTMLGQVYSASAKFQATAAQPAMKAASEMAEKWKNASEENQNALREMQQRAGSDLNKQWQEALQVGLDAKLHGATTQGAKDAARIALAAMGREFEDKQFDVEINARINFDDAEARLKTLETEMKNRFTEMQSNAGLSFGESLVNVMQGGDYQELSARDTVSLEALARKYAELYSSANAEQRKQLVQGVIDQTDFGLQDVWKKELEKLAGSETDSSTKQYYLELMNADLTKVDPADIEAITSQMSETDRTIFMKRLAIRQTMYKNFQAEFNKIKPGELITELDAGNDPNKMKQIEEQLKVINMIRQGLGMSAGYTASTAPDNTIGISKAWDNYINGVKGAAASGKVLNEQQKLQILNQQRVAMGLEETGNLYDWFGTITVKVENGIVSFSDRLAQLGITGEDAAARITQSWKNIYSGASENLFSRAELLASGKSLFGISEAADAVAAKMTKANETREKTAKAAFDARWTSKTDSVTKFYDTQITSIDKAIEAEKRAEELRQKAFEAEKQRIQQLTELRNAEIDISVAIRSGSLDEAAKLQNEMQSKQIDWANAGVTDTSQSASDARVAKLEGSKKLVEDEKKSKIDSLEAVRAKEQEILDASIKADKDATDRKIKARKEAADRELKIIEGKFQAELSALRAFIPKNDAELKTQMTKIQAVYKKYGVDLSNYGNNWGKIVGESLTRNINIERNKIASDKGWETAGDDIITAMTKGSFGMTPDQFFKWIAGGEAPASSAASLDKYTKNMNAHTNAQNSKTASILHDGGVVGMTAPSRTGYSGGIKPGERMALLRVGEGVVNNRAMRHLGVGGLNAINKGIGGGGPGMFGPAMIGALGKKMVEQAVAGAGRKRIELDTAGSLGASVAGALTGSQDDNARRVFQRLLSAGFTPQAAAGVIGNLIQESNINPSAVQPGGPGRGIMQWSKGDRWDKLQRWAMINGKNPMGLDTQVDWMLKEMSDYGVLSSMKRMTDIALATKYFEGTMEKAGIKEMERRIRYANETFSKFGHTGPSQNPVDGEYFGSKIQMELQNQGATAYPAVGTEPNFGHGSYQGGVRFNAIRPVPGPFTSFYGPRNFMGMTFHNGIDIGAPAGTPIKAAAAGKVIFSGWSNRGYGNYVAIAHPDGTITAYAHQSEILARAGQQVAAGQMIGKVGSTGNSSGPHLHFQAGRNGAWFDPKSAWPSLNVGGMTLNDGYAKLHKKEAVLTKPLTEKFEQGVENFASGPSNSYSFGNIIIGEGNNVTEAQVEKILKKVFDEAQRKAGSVRTVR